MRCALAILIGLVLVGCDPIATKRVTLAMGPHRSLTGTQATSRVQVDTKETEAAIKIVDRVLQEHGLGDGGPYPDSQAGVIKWWGLTLEQAREQQRGSLTCRAYLRDDQLEVLFSEFGRLHSSTDVKDMTAEIRSAFVDRFGRDRVR